MREPFDGGDGVVYTRTELDQVVVGGQDACPSSLAAADLDGDGQADLIAIESPGFNDDAAELVALHGPSGRIVWRALKGSVAHRLVLSDGVVVVEGDDESLHGVDSRSGAKLWTTKLPAELSDDPYGDVGMTWNSAALCDHGTHVAFACEDGSAHVLESKTGRLTVSKQGRLLEHGHGIPGVVAFAEGGMMHKIVDLWDVAKNRSIMRARTQGYVPMAISPEGTLYVFNADILPNDVPMTRVSSFDMETRAPRRDVWVAPSDQDNVVPHRGLSSSPHRLAALGEERLLLGSDDDERGGAISIDLKSPPKTIAPKPPAVRPVSRIPPPQPGYQLRALEVFGDVVVAVWEHEDSHKIMALGLDRGPLTPRWFVGDAGGGSMKNHSLRTSNALLLPFSPTRKLETKVGAPVYWAHIDPQSGARVGQYFVRELDCVRMHGKYLVGHSTSFPAPPPIVWDTERRERAL